MKGVLLAFVALLLAPRPTFTRDLIRAAVAQTASRVTYDGSYRRIAYPGGDVPAHIGVCTSSCARTAPSASISRCGSTKT